MKSWFQKFGFWLAVLATLLFAATLVYFMPRAAMVTITGTDVKRLDVENRKPNQDKTRDVRYIYAANVDDGKARAFRNEDNAWYFKFDSGDLAAEAMNLAQTETADIAQGKKDVVLVKYYGVRIPIFHMYPNMISLKKVPADYVYIPYFNIFFLLALLLGFLWLGAKLRKVFRRDGSKNGPSGKATPA